MKAFFDTSIVRAAALVAPIAAAVVLGALAYAPGAATARTYYTNLPSGVEQISIGSDTTNAAETDGLVLDDQPLIHGYAAIGTTSIEITIASTPVTYIVPVDPLTGYFEFKVPDKLEPGSHELFIGGSLVGVGSFSVATAPAPPAAGSAGLAAGGGAGLDTALQLGALALVIALPATTSPTALAISCSQPARRGGPWALPSSTTRDSRCAWMGSHASREMFGWTSSLLCPHRPGGRPLQL